MESVHVNWEALDALVVEFAKSENLIEEQPPVSSSSPPSSPSSSSPSSSSPSSPSSSSYHSRLLIRQIRRSLEAGDIDAALDLLRAHAPFVLDDHRLLFRLQKQKFIELLRRGTVEDRDSAINCLRTDVAPCALDAYPEAYEEFKHILLAFIFDKDDQTSPVANEWSERRRLDIAGLMSSVLRAQLHAYDPILSMTLRYLICIHKGFCLRQGISSPISNLTERLLLEERDPAATPQESLFEAPPFDEVDIQSLAHAVELTRQGAVDSLRVAKGDLFQAFQSELCRMGLDVTLLDELVREYCVYRGIVDSSSGMQSALGPLQVADQRDSLSRKYSLEVDCSMSDAHIGSPDVNVDTVSMQGMDTEHRCPSETSSSLDVCSTSGTHHPDSLKILQRRKCSGLKDRNKRKRWRGRQEKLDIISEVPCRSSKQAPSPTTSPSSCISSKEQQVCLPCGTLDSVGNIDDKYEIVLVLKELASRGMAAEVVEEVNAMDPDFFQLNPLLLFQLKQVEFLKLVKCGDHSSALKVACSYLGPLAANDPTLLKLLKETLLALLRPNEDALGKGLSLNTLATSLQVAIGRRLGIEEPQLMKIMRATLYTHGEWFKLQMCKDRFEGLLKIDSLKEVGSPLVAADAVTKSNADSCTLGSSQVTVSSSNRMQEDGSSPTQASSTEVVCDENAIVKVMEFLALPRADAIHLLGQYNGNAEAVIQQIFA